MTVSFSNLSKKYDTDWIFENISGEFSRGGHAILGKNGSGKSTLLQIISGFVTPSKGELVYKNDVGAEVDAENVYKHISICSPMMELFEELHVEEMTNLHHRMKPLSKEPSEILEIIELNKHANKSLDKLSSGMKQRLKLALTIYSQSEVLFFDEPCSNLDERWSDWYSEEVSKLAKERTVIIASNSQAKELAPVNGVRIELN